MWTWWEALTTRSRMDGGDHGVREERVPINPGTVCGDHEAFCLPFGDELIEIVGLGGKELPHREVIE